MTSRISQYWLVNNNHVDHTKAIKFQNADNNDAKEIYNWISLHQLPIDNNDNNNINLQSRYQTVLETDHLQCYQCQSQATKKLHKIHNCSSNLSESFYEKAITHVLLINSCYNQIVEILIVLFLVNCLTGSLIDLPFATATRAYNSFRRDVSSDDSILIDFHSNRNDSSYGINLNVNRELKNNNQFRESQNKNRYENWLPNTTYFNRIGHSIGSSALTYSGLQVQNNLNDHLIRSQNFKINPKPCTIGLFEGTCMFVWECIKSEGRHMGMCVDSFMFGSCCAHNYTDNIILPNTFSYTRPTKPVGIGSLNHRPPLQPHRPIISGMTTIERPHGAGTLVIRPSGPHHQGVLSKPLQPKPIHTSIATLDTVSSSTSISIQNHTENLNSSPSIQSSVSVNQQHFWHLSTEPNFITKPRPPGWDKPVILRPKPSKPFKKPINSTLIWLTSQYQTTTDHHFHTYQTATRPTISTIQSSDNDQISSTHFITRSTTKLPKPTNSWAAILSSAMSSLATSTSNILHNNMMNNDKLNPANKPYSTSNIMPSYSKPTSNQISSSISTFVMKNPIPTTTKTTNIEFYILNNLPIHRPNQHNETTTNIFMSTVTPTDILNTTTSPNRLSNTTTTRITTISVAPTLSTPNLTGFYSLVAPTPANFLSTLDSNAIADNSEHIAHIIKTISAARGECGVPILTRPEIRIVGGKTAAFGRWPWQVSVRRTSFFGFSSTHRCGGALLNENWIATAGHCVDDLLISQIRIRVGEYDFSHVQEQLPYIEKGVAKKIVHPQYNFFTYEYDLALVKLEQPLEFAPHVSPICLPQTDSLLIGMNATVTGWGRLSEGGTLPSILQEVSVPIVSNDKCKSMFLRAGRQEFIPEIFLCAGYETGGQDSCQGDSGGPLQVKSQDGRYFLAGIISWGIGCAEANLPGVCTRISKFVPWIMENVT